MEIIETDGLYVLEVPSFIPQVVKAVAKIKGMKETEMAGQILQNFTDFFAIGLFRSQALKGASKPT